MATLMRVVGGFFIILIVGFGVLLLGEERLVTGQALQLALHGLVPPAR